MRILVSACLLGLPVRYDGLSKPCERVVSLRENHILIPICPEQLGGLPTPRPRAEISNGRVVNEFGEDVTENFKKGAMITLKIAEVTGVELAILKSKSPSCGIGLVYDGSFSGRLVEGNGMTAELLIENGYRVVDENSEIVEKLRGERT